MDAGVEKMQMLCMGKRIESLDLGGNGIIFIQTNQSGLSAVM